MRTNRSVLAILAAVALVASIPGIAGAANASGTFSDDDGNIHESAIEAIAAARITSGCNPPANSRYCPDSAVTRGQMAEFLVEILDLPSTKRDFFDDDDNSIFESSINRLAAANIGRGCNPEEGNTRFCPDGKVTRGQMAALIARALDLDDNGRGDYFDDDDASIFEGDIDRIAAAGITKGCNPPTNTRFCPQAVVQRDQVASFLVRAFDIPPAPKPSPRTAPPSPTVPPSSTEPSSPSVSPDAGGRWVPAPGVSWQWQLTGSIDTTVDADVFNVDLFDVSKATVQTLQAKGAKVICYLSAGSYENWRPDADEFPAQVLGRSNGWAGEQWLDIRRIDLLGPIMEARMDLCGAKGFDGVEPDNIDGYTNNTGFALSASDQLAYNRFLANAAHERGLSIGLKNDLDQVRDLVNVFDFAINEECAEWNECAMLSPFINAGKAVFHVEYSLAPIEFCPTTTALGFSSLLKNYDLDAWRRTCP